MEKEQLQQFREQLEEMKGEIISDVEQTLTDMTSHHGNIPDPNDRATIESDREFELRLRSRERKLLDKIELAIGRIDNGTYGICADCEEPPLVSGTHVRVRPCKRAHDRDLVFHLFTKWH